jgi:hypothetical protein
MRRFNLTIVLVLFLLVSIVSGQQTASTSVPNLIRYSGTLKDAQGAPVSSSTAIGVSFAIYNQEDGGAAVWQETQNISADAHGQYSVILGSTTAAGLPGDLFSQQEQRWLGVQVQGQEEQARVLLVSVPYAFKAHEADTLGGLPASAFIQAAPPSASGSGATPAGTAVNALSKVGGTSSGVGPSAKHPPGPCNPQSGYLTYWDSTGALCASSLLQIANGNIGIGVTNPSEPLDVQGAISTYTWYDIFEQPVLTVGNPVSAANTNLFVGFFAGSNNASGTYDTFAGRESGFNNGTGNWSAFFGYRAGYNNINGNSNTFLGYQSGFYTVTGNNNTYVGRSTGFKATGSNNVCVGYGACYSSSASNNTFIGYNSGNLNTVGAGNTFLGNEAGSANVSGAGNTFLGNNAGLNSFASGGGNCCNTIVGDAAGQGGSGDVAAGNSYFGYQAGAATTTGGKNVFSGYNSGLANTTGSFNSFYGDQSGQSLTTGNYNTFLGISTAGSFTSGSYNTFVGQFAGNNTTGGNSDVYLANPGANTENNTLRIGDNGTGSGQQNLVFVTPILSNQTTLTSPYVVTINNTSGQLGYQTIAAAGGVTGTCSSGLNYITKWFNATTVQCSSIYENTTAPTIGPQVGIGTGATFQTGPSAKLEVAYSDLVTTQNPFPSALRLMNMFQTQSDLTQTGIMFNASVNSANEDVSRIYAVWDGTGVSDGRFTAQVRDGHGVFDNVLNVTHDGPSIGGSVGGVLGINTISNLATLDVNGGTSVNDPIGNVRIFELDPFVSGQSQSVCRNSSTLVLSLCAGSSRRFKEQIADMGDNSSKLFQLHPVTFFYKPQYDDGSHQLQHGLIAEEVAKVYPDLVEYQKDGQPYTVKYQMLTPLLLNELQKQHSVVMAQQDELQTQLRQIKAQQQQMQTQSQEISSLRLQLQQQNASLQVRLSKLESYVASQTQMKTASDIQPATTVEASGDSQ